MQIIEILKEAAGKKASDVFIITGAALAYKVEGNIVKYNEEPLRPEITKELVIQIFDIAGLGAIEFSDVKKELDFSFSINGVGRFRANIYRQRGSYSAVLRFVPFELPRAEELGIPSQVKRRVYLASTEHCQRNNSHY